MKLINTLRTVICFAGIFALPVLAQLLAEPSQPPGFRPRSDYAQQFVAGYREANIHVYPSIIRSPLATGYSRSSQEQVVAFVNGHQLGKASAVTPELDPGALKGRAQYAMFENDLEVLGAAVKEDTAAADYQLVMEFLLPPPRGEQLMVFGIHCFVFDKQGHNAFSFLLNSHHKPFVEAQLMGADSDQGRAELIAKATDVALNALLAQIKSAHQPKINVAMPNH